jgi:predicted ATPase/class 3 adenylate cyclase
MGRQDPGATASNGAIELPTGTVTFLFTDIEGSTRMLQQHAADYAEILHSHRRLIRTAVADEAGIEVDNTGDGFFFVFPSTTGAIRTAAAAQQALAAAPWPDGASVRVRMGLHTGEGRLGVEGYVGIDVHRAARVGAAAHGGQVLLSEATSALVRRDLPSGFALRDLGLHRLKDLDAPERMAQLVVPGLPSDFPPPRGVSKRQGLPVRLSRFIGRGPEIEELRVLLRSNRLLTLTGPGGTGKTRLALAVAGAEEGQYLDGAAFVDLAPIVDPELVPSATGGKLEAPSLPGRSPTEAVIKHLAERRLLLVLDNFEQVLAAAPFVAELLAGCPDLSVLVTSRAPLRLEGEQEWPVAPLDLPDPSAPQTLDALTTCEAIQLFTERARSVQPAFTLTEDNAPSVADICRRLDGIPLAIELAAARVRLTPPAVLNEGLATIDLGGGGRDVPERQRTLRNAIAWSVDLLDEADRRLFRRLAVFRGGWTFDAVQQVLGKQEGSDVVEGLQRLLEHSLIKSDNTDEPRGSMLETIRAFAADELLRSGELPEFSRCHADFFLALAEEAAPYLLGPDRDPWLDRLGRDHDNVRAAIEWATSVGDIGTALRLSTALMTFWHLRNQMSEGRTVLDALLESDTADVEPAIVAGALAAAGELAVYSMDFSTSIGYVNRSLAIYRQIGDVLGSARQLNNLGWANSIPNGDAALSFFEEALDISRETGVGEVIGNALLGAATIHIRVGRIDEGRRDALAARAAFDDAGERYLYVYLLLDLGRIEDLQGHPDAAIALFAEALRMASLVGEGGVICTSLSHIADLLLDHGDHALAIALAAASERRLRQIGGATTVEMSGLEPPMLRGARLVEPTTFARASSDEEALTIDDAVHEALAVARRVEAGLDVLHASSV